MLKGKLIHPEKNSNFYLEFDDEFRFLFAWFKQGVGFYQAVWIMNRI